MYREFEGWLAERNVGMTLEEMALGHVGLLGECLREKGYDLFETRRSKNDFRDLVSAAADQFGWTRHSLSAARRVGGCLALQSVRWGWFSIRAMCLIGYSGMLGPLEMLGSCRALT